MSELKNFWATPADDLIKQLNSGASGITSLEAKKRLDAAGPDRIKQKRKASGVLLFFSQFKSPIILILLCAIVLSFYLNDTLDAFIILAIVLISGLLGFWQEYGANNAVAKLLAMVQIKTEVLRDGKSVEVGIDEVVPGDVVVVNAGDIIPGDCLILSSNALFVDEATLTGETYPIEKESGVLPADTVLSQRKNALWMGTHVVSGTASALVLQVGQNTEFGKISERLKQKPQETEFERGIRKFGFFLMEITLILVLAIFAVNVLLQKPFLDSFLFSLALAVGLTPQLLPAIISINLAHGAREMAKVKVIVKRLASIENFGSMDVLCSDKTGTLTDGTVRLNAALDMDSKESDQVLLYAYLNASFESGFVNPIDEAIRSYKKLDISSFSKIDEEPYDFIRKRLSILLSETGDFPEGKRR
ncbi:MAG: HAD-IC family P-type ATPase, partial [Eubacteriales bacterium]